MPPTTGRISQLPASWQATLTAAGLLACALAVTEFRMRGARRRAAASAAGKPRSP